MKNLLLPLALFLLLTLSASGMQAAASTPATEAYLRERDKAYAALSTLSTDRIDTANRQWTDRLQAMMRKLIGPVQIAGFAGPCRYTIDPGVVDPNDATDTPLDGLACDATDGSHTSLTVTTWPLLQIFLKAVEGKAKTSPGPVSVAAALGSEDIYTSINNDPETSAFGLADLPVTAAPGSTAKAILFGTSEDDTVDSVASPRIGVAILQGGRVFIFIQPVRLAVKLDAIPACQPLFRKASAPGSEAELRAFRLCIRREIPKQPDYPRLIRQAQALVSRVTGKP